MELSSEDMLRLNVLLANAQAIRIDEQNMIVFGLAEDKEQKIKLNPNCRADQYLNLVRDMLSTTVLGSPRSYPIYIRRWARMGQINNAPLEKLLLLGEPEAILAVASSKQLTDEFARRAWWASPTPEIARRMLTDPRVVQGAMGKILADYLVEFLPFETEPLDILETVQLILQPGLTDEATRERIWAAGKRRKAYRIGFLEMRCDDLPQSVTQRADTQLYRELLNSRIEAGSSIAVLAGKVLSAAGQTFLDACKDILQRPSNQDEVSAVLNAMGKYFASLRFIQHEVRDMEWLQQYIRSCCEQPKTLDENVEDILSVAPELMRDIEALLVLAHIDEAVVTPVFAQTDAVGSVMRNKIEPVIRPVMNYLTELSTPKNQSSDTR